MNKKILINLDEKIKVRITKLDEVENLEFPNNIPIGYDVERITLRELFKIPTVGERFTVGGFSSSLVQEIVDENTFKTFNSIYRWEIV